MKKYLATILILSLTTLATAQDFVYHTITMRAAPGKLLELIELIRDDIRKFNKYGINKPVLMRHSQGDHWDLMMIIPVGETLDGYFTKDAIKARSQSNTISQPYASDFYDFISHMEEVYALGPKFDDFQQGFQRFDYYHVEMFVALAGKRRELIEQREMENEYLRRLDRRENFIFTKVTGSEVDIFTIGLYRDLQHFAESSNVSPEDEEKAAKKAGFEGASFIGSYLRELILEHHDTLAGAVREY